MNLDRFQELLDAYGADPDRWPEAERRPALALLAASDEARARAASARALDALLDQSPGLPLPTMDPAALAARIAQTPQPRRRAAPTAPAWRVSLGWPSLAGLAAAAVAGFVIGWSGIDGGLAFTGDADSAAWLSPITAEEETLW